MIAQTADGTPTTIAMRSPVLKLVLPPPGVDVVVAAVGEA